MKKYLYIVLPFLISINLSFTATEPTFTGNWLFIDSGDSIIFQFEKDSSVSITTMGEKIGGTNYLYEGKSYDMIYELFADQSPKAIDIVLREHQSQKVFRRASGIYEFINSNKLKIYIDLEGNQKRAKSFPATESPELVILTRMK